MITRFPVQQPSQKTFEETNYMTAAALMASGVPFVGTEANGRLHFCFADPGNAKEIIRRFWDRSLSIDALTLAEKIRDCKKLISEEMTKHKGKIHEGHAGFQTHQ